MTDLDHCCLRRGNAYMEVVNLDRKHSTVGHLVDVRAIDTRTGTLRPWSNGWTVTKSWPMQSGWVTSKGVPVRALKTPSRMSS